MVMCYFINHVQSPANLANITYNHNTCKFNWWWLRITDGCNIIAEYIVLTLGKYNLLNAISYVTTNLLSVVERDSVATSVATRDYIYTIWLLSE